MNCLFFEDLIFTMTKYFIRNGVILLQAIVIRYRHGTLVYNSGAVISFEVVTYLLKVYRNFTTGLVEIAYKKL